MAQASSSAQKEPSMEEILASIRRIIEDSDAAGNAASETSSEPVAEMEAIDATAADADIAPPEPETAFEDEMPVTNGQLAEDQTDVASEAEMQSFEEEFSAEETPVAEDDSSALEEVSANSSEEGPVFEGEATETPEDASTTDSAISALSLSDIQAEVANQSNFAASEEADDDDVSEVEPLVHRDEPVDDDQVDDVAPMSADNVADTDNVATAMDSDGSGSLAALAQSIANEAAEEAAAEDAVEPSPAVDPVASDVLAGPDETVPSISSAPIISEQAGRQVAAAFDELSEAISQPQNAKFDAMAEKMMRPMLQEWLDNNLPVLVERLVREEIDRVARGAP